VRVGDGASPGKGTNTCGEKKPERKLVWGGTKAKLQIAKEKRRCLRPVRYSPRAKRATAKTRGGKKGPRERGPQNKKMSPMSR